MHYGQWHGPVLQQEVKLGGLEIGNMIGNCEYYDIPKFWLQAENSVIFSSETQMFSVDKKENLAYCSKTFGGACRDDFAPGWNLYLPWEHWNECDMKEDD